MVSKSIKTFLKTLKTARPGRRTLQDLRIPVELPYAPEVCPGGQDTAPFPLKTFRIGRDSEDVARPWLKLPLQVRDQQSEILARYSQELKRPVRYCLGWNWPNDMPWRTRVESSWQLYMGVYVEGVGGSSPNPHCSNHQKVIHSQTWSQGL